jgi:phosphoglycolate phosphatase
MNKMNILFDLDGTILDSKVRLYRLFCDITLQTGLSFDDYWNLKRSKKDHQFILKKYFNYSHNEYLDFERKWLSLIETEEYHQYDELFDFTDKVLQTLRLKGHNLYIVTARQSKEKTLQQIKNTGIYPYFDAILITENQQTKLELIRKSEIQLSVDDIMIGDTGIDIKTAKELNLVSIAVLSGFRNKEVLSLYSPDFIKDNILFLLNYVKD